MRKEKPKGKSSALGDIERDAAVAVAVEESEIKSLEADGLDILALLNAWNKS